MSDEKVLQREDKPAEKSKHVCVMCGYETHESFNFCPNCGAISDTPDYSEILGIEITDDDIEKYLFMGYIEKDIKLSSKPEIVVRLRTLTERDSNEAMKAAVNEFREQYGHPEDNGVPVTQSVIDNLQSQWTIRKAIVSINGSEYDPEVTPLGTALFNIIRDRLTILQSYLGYILQRGDLQNF